MKKKSNMITDIDMKRLSSILDDRVCNKDSAAQLEERLASLTVVDCTTIPDDLVTMNSKFRGIVRTENSPDEVRTFTLTYPRTADITDGRISIMTPLGMKLLGARQGDIIDWRGNDGSVRKMLLDEVLYQPEASGDWNL